jgi:hypothetical protein
MKVYKNITVRTSVHEHAVNKPDEFYYIHIIHLMNEWLFNTLVLFK